MLVPTRLPFQPPLLPPLTSIIALTQAPLVCHNQMVNSRQFLQPLDFGGSNISSQRRFGQLRISSYSVTGLCSLAVAIGRWLLQRGGSRMQIMAKYLYKTYTETHIKRELVSCLCVGVSFEGAVPTGEACDEDNVTALSKTSYFVYHHVFLLNACICLYLNQILVYN